jgi:multicomponent K+:H+ antiporter subunit C
MSAEALVAITIGVFAACGLWLLLRTRSFDLVLGLTLLGYAVNLFLFASGRLTTDAAAFIGEQGPLPGMVDPLPQALVLTAIVIGFAMSALLLAIAIATHSESGTDHVDGALGHGTDGERADGGDPRNEET